MSDEIIKNRKEKAALQKKYDKISIKCEHLLLDLHKAKLDVQEEMLKYKIGIFQLKEKVAIFKSELDGLKHKASFSHSEWENIRKKGEKLRAEIKPRDIESLDSDPL